MNRKLIVKTAFLTGLMLAVLTGMLIPKSAVRATTYTAALQNWPGGGSSLNCGWHGGACWDDDRLVQSGSALDWGPYSSVIWKSTAWTDYGSNRTIASGNIWYPAPSQCSHLPSVDVYDSQSTWRASVLYQHVSPTASGYFWIGAGSFSSPVTTTSTLGVTANETGCSAWTDYHVHQQSGGGWYKMSYPDHTACNRPTITSGCIGPSCAMLGTSWGF